MYETLETKLPQTSQYLVDLICRESDPAKRADLGERHREICDRIRALANPGQARHMDEYEPAKLAVIAANRELAEAAEKPDQASEALERLNAALYAVDRVLCNGVTAASGRKKKPFWEAILEIGASIPKEELAKLPRDGAKNYRHYLYGHAKEEE